MQSFGIMTMFELFIGIYLIYAAIKGEGKLYENEYLNCSREEDVKVMRVLAAITGVLLMITGGLELFGIVDPASVEALILWAVGFASIIAMLIYSSKKTDRAAARAGRPTNLPESKTPYDPLRAAFVFDEEDEEEQAGE